jgi:hypothetical protein
MEEHMVYRRGELRMSDRFRLEGRHRPSDEDATESLSFAEEDAEYGEHDEEPSHESMKRQSWGEGRDDSSRKRPLRRRRAEA